MLKLQWKKNKTMETDHDTKSGTQRSKATTRYVSTKWITQSKEPSD